MRHPLHVHKLKIRDSFRDTFPSHHDSRFTMIRVGSVWSPPSSIDGGNGSTETLNID
jgi:hypothetical protein